MLWAADDDDAVSTGDDFDILEFCVVWFSVFGFAFWVAGSVRRLEGGGGIFGVFFRGRTGWEGCTYATIR